MRIILASRSPRRELFLDMLGLEFEIMPSRVDERKVREKDPIKLARKLARMKAEDVAKRIMSDSRSMGPEKKVDAVVIGADTLVAFEGMVIGKAKDKEHAFRILSHYSGREHVQITGMCLINTRTGKVMEDHDATMAVCRRMSEKEIREYVETGEPMEGAGCYTPRAHAMLFEKLRGSWTNVVGLPMERFIPLLGEAMRG